MEPTGFLQVVDSDQSAPQAARKFTSRWAIPRVDDQETPKPRKKRIQVNNIVLLFLIYVFRQTKKLVSPKKQNPRNL
jgi:hypothetical protein